MILYAARLILYPDAILRLKAFDRYSLHRIVNDFFPKNISSASESDEKYPILWVDKGEHVYGHEIHILSARRPTILSLPSDIQFAYRRIPDSYWSYNQYKFSLVCNPTKTYNDFCDGVVVRKRIGLYSESDVAAWFKRKASEGGFSAQLLSFDKKDKIKLKRKNELITYCSIRISGVLNIINKELFLRAVANRIGQGKAFGFGFLQVVPVI